MRDLRASLRRVRFRADTGFEMLCDECDDFWPMTLEYWFPQSLARCLACRRDRLTEQRHGLPPERRNRLREKWRTSTRRYRLRKRRRALGLVVTA